MIKVFYVWISLTLVVMFYRNLSYYKMLRGFRLRKTLFDDFFKYLVNVAIAIFCFFVFLYLFGYLEPMSDAERELYDRCITPDLCW